MPVDLNELRTRAQAVLDAQDGVSLFKARMALYATDFVTAVLALISRVEAAEANLALLSDPESVRVNIMRGTIAKPDDLVFLHDTNGPVAALKAENERLRGALGEIDRRYIPDQPAGYGGDELAWVQRHVGTLRGIARTALETTNG